MVACLVSRRRDDRHRRAVGQGGVPRKYRRDRRRGCEGALAKKQAVASEAEALRGDRAKIASELDLVRTKAGELVTTNKSAVGKIDAAMSRIRAVLHSNSGS